MIDIHCHILPGADDGAADMEMALQMARMAAADGVRAIVATPHYAKDWNAPRHIVLEKLALLQAELNQARIPIQLYPGNEVRIYDADFFYDGMEREQFCYLAGNRGFLLIEQPWAGYVVDMEHIVAELAGQGTRSVIAHPERHVFFQRSPELLDRLLALGVWTQLSVGSLIGEHGAVTQAFANELLDRGLVHTLASDAHNLVTRKPLIAAGYEAVARRAGEEAAQAIHKRMATIIRPSYFLP